MCGIVGVLSPLKTAFTYKDKKLFEDLLFMDTLRGHHGTGLIGVDLANEEEATTYKRALAGPDFLQLKNTKTLITQNEYLIGHNRWATQGAHSDDNSHPFSHGDVVGVHNGTLVSSWKSKDGAKLFEVDSDWLLWSISENGVAKTFYDLEGAWVVVWVDVGKGTFNVVKNKERPLSMGKVRQGADTSLAFASEGHMLTTALNRSSFSLVKEYTIKNHIHYEMKIGDPLFNLKETPIERFKKVVVDKDWWKAYGAKGYWEEPEKKVKEVEGEKEEKEELTVVDMISYMPYSARDTRGVAIVSLQDRGNELKGKLYGLTKAKFKELQNEVARYYYTAIVKKKNKEGFYHIREIKKIHDESHVFCDGCSTLLTTPEVDRSNKSTNQYTFCDWCLSKEEEEEARI